MTQADSKTVLFLFGSQPGEAAILEARALCEPLRRRGWRVRLAGLSARAARALQEGIGLPAEALAWGPAWLPVVGGLFVRRKKDVPDVVHAWGREAARAARGLARRGSHLCVTLDSADVRIGEGAPTKLPPAVDLAVVQAALSRREQVRAALRLEENGGPVLVSPPSVMRGSGHLEAAWAVFLLRRGGVRARLVLPHAGRESSRIVRFAVACEESAGIVVAGADIGWLDLLAAADLVVVPDHGKANPVLTGCALGSGRAVVVRLQEGSANPADESLLSARTAILAADARPLSLARSLLAAWQDRQMTAEVVRVAGEQVARRCKPQAVAEAYLQMYSAVRSCASGCMA